MTTTTAVKERPILFSGPMVRAILEGRKTMTRRVVKPQPFTVLSRDEWHSRAMSGVDPYGCRPIGSRVLEEMQDECPYGKPGERLWVRETFAKWTSGNCKECCVYRADVPQAYEWKPSIHMPRWASRITLEITDVQVERLQEITEADAIREGSQIPVAELPASCRSGCLTERTAFSRIWESINGAGSWANNPWVWVVSFTRAGS